MDNSKDDEKKAKWWDILVGGWKVGTQGVKDKVTDFEKKTGKKISVGLSRNELVQQTGSKLIGSAISGAVENITTNANSLTKEGLEKLEIGENYDTYKTIKDCLGKPEDKGLTKVWNSILGRVLDAATGIAGYVGAAFVNIVYKPVEGEKASGSDLHKLFANFMSKVLGGPKVGVPVATPVAV